MQIIPFIPIKIKRTGSDLLELKNALQKMFTNAIDKDLIDEVQYYNIQSFLLMLQKKLLNIAQRSYNAQSHIHTISIDLNQCEALYYLFLSSKSMLDVYYFSSFQLFFSEIDKQRINQPIKKVINCDEYKYHIDTFKPGTL